MPTNRRIRVAFGKTINIGNFESVRIDVELSGDIADGDDQDECTDELYANAVQYVEAYEADWKR